MERQTLRARLRGPLRDPWLYKAAGVLLAVLLAAVLLLAVFFNNGTPYALSPLGLGLAALLGVFLCFVFSRLFLLLGEPGPTGETVFALVVGILLVAWQILFALSLTAAPPAGAVTTLEGMAAAWVQQGQMPQGLGWLAGGGGAFVLASALFSLFGGLGVTSFALPALVVNIIAVNLAILLGWRCCRRLFGPGQALLYLVGLAVCVPLWMHLPLLSAASLALPFASGGALLWLRARAAWRKNETTRALRRWLLLSALLALGALLHPFLLVLWLATALDLICLLSGPGRAPLFFGGLGVVALLLGGGLLGLWYGWGIPVLGASASPGWGSGALGVIFGLGGRLSGAYGEPSLGAAALLGDGSAAPLRLSMVFSAGGARYATAAYAAFAWLGGALVWALVAAIGALRRRNHALGFLRLALLGWLIWQAVQPAGADVLLFQLPLLLLAAMEAAPRAAATAPKEIYHHEPTAGPAQGEDEATPPDYMDPTFNLNTTAAPGEPPPLIPQPAEDTPELFRGLLEDAAPGGAQPPAFEWDEEAQPPAALFEPPANTPPEPPKGGWQLL